MTETQPLTPAPVSSPAGEDVERVARVLDPSAFNPTASVPICFGQTPESAREEAQEAARDEARRVLAALSARPVEAQEVERRLRAEITGWDFGARVVRDERDAALARAEAAAGFARWLVSLDDDDPQSEGRQARRMVTLSQIIDRARALLDGDSEGREIGRRLNGDFQAEEEWGAIWYGASDVEDVFDTEQEAREFVAERAEPEEWITLRRTVTAWVPVEDEARP